MIYATEIAPNESIGSYFFRQNIIYADIYSKVSKNYFSSNINWRNIPDTRFDSFNNLTDKIHKKHSLAALYRPTSGNKRFHHLDFRSSSIVFCPECFFEQICNYGFIWFLKDWQIYKANACFKHHRKLEVPYCKKCGSFFGTFDKLNYLLLGKCPTCNNKMWPEEKYISAEPSRISVWLKSVLEADFLYFHPEFRKELLNEAYLLGGGNIYDSDHKVGIGLWNMYKTALGENSKYVNQYAKYHIQKAYIDKNNNISILMFWMPLMVAFINFDNFKDSFKVELKNYRSEK